MIYKYKGFLIEVEEYGERYDNDGPYTFGVTVIHKGGCVYYTEAVDVEEAKGLAEEYILHSGSYLVNSEDD